MTCRLATWTLVLLGVPALADACPVCFGAADGPMLQGSGMGILALLVVTVLVLGAFGLFFRTLARRSAAVTDVVSQLGSVGGRSANEGTAR